MKLLITGCRGQLGSDLTRYFTGGAWRAAGTPIELKSARAEYQVSAVDIEDIDLTDREAVPSLIETVKPDVIIHPAAYTAVDKAESNKDAAFKVNADAVAYLAVAAKKNDAALLLYSTDYVFDGTQRTPYVETDKPNPTSIYGASKLKGEENLQSVMQRFYIMRVSWLCGHYGANFLKTMIRVANENKPLRVVNDEYGSPTFTAPVCRQTEKLLQSGKYGLYHSACQGATTRHEFAKEILKRAGKGDYPVASCLTAEYPTIAKRPQYSVFENKALKDAGLLVMPEWRAALDEYFATIPPDAK